MAFGDQISRCFGEGAAEFDVKPVSFGQFMISCRIGFIGYSLVWFEKVGLDVCMVLAFLCPTAYSAFSINLTFNINIWHMDSFGAGAFAPWCSQLCLFQRALGKRWPQDGKSHHILSYLIELDQGTVGPWKCLRLSELWRGVDWSNRTPVGWYFWLVQLRHCDNLSGKFAFARVCRATSQWTHKATATRLH